MICHARILRERIRVWTRRIRLVRKSEFSDRMHEDRSAGFDQPPSTERANDDKNNDGGKLIYRDGHTVKVAGSNAGARAAAAKLAEEAANDGDADAAAKAANKAKNKRNKNIVEY